MKKLSISEFRKLDEISKVAYAYAKKWNYYKFYEIRPMRRGWKYWESCDDKHHKEMYCPLCRKYTQIVHVNWMNWISFYNKMTYYDRCEYCLLKLPVLDKEIQRLLGFNEKPKELPRGQMILQ